MFQRRAAMNYYRHQKKLTEKLPTNIQSEIITDITYPDYLLAGAGTGKTEVLIKKILHILENDKSVDLSNFAIITFTNKATDEMQERLLDRLYLEWLKHKKIAGRHGKIKSEEYMRKQVEIAQMVDISTIHGFCEKILRKYSLNIGVALNFEIKSVKSQLNLFITESINQYANEAIFAQIPQYKIAKLLDVFYHDNVNKGNEIKNEDIQKFSFKNENNEYWNEFKNVFLKIYVNVVKKIDQFKIDNNILTTDDLIKKAAQLMKNNHVAKKVSQQYHYIFIDEFQDTNRDQYYLVESLIEHGVKVFLVGDIKQSIYAFRGADVQNSDDMAENIAMIKSKTEVHREPRIMNENFRTDFLLLEKVNKIFDHDFSFDGEKMHFPNMKLKKIEALKDPNLSDDNPLRFVFEKSTVDIIVHLVNNTQIKDRTNSGKRNVRYEDIAILCRSNYDLDALALELKLANIPVEVVGGKGFFKSKEIIDTFKIFNSVINDNVVYQTELIFTDYYKAIQENCENLSFTRFLIELKTAFREETIEGILDFIYTKSNIKEYYLNYGKYQEIANLQKLKDKARDLLSKEYIQPIQFLEYLNIMITTEKEEDDAEIPEMDRAKGVVSLYSIHKAKGLAFPVVIIPHFDKKINRPIINPKIIYHDGGQENKLAIGKEYFKDDIESEDKDYLDMLDTSVKKHIEEEIRILYVALTRPQHMLILSCDEREKELEKKIQKKDFVSWAKWINEIDDGEFLKSHIWNI